jgi:hypothetical protein
MPFSVASIVTAPAAASSAVPISRRDVPSTETVLAPEYPPSATRKATEADAPLVTETDPLPDVPT